MANRKHKKIQPTPPAQEVQKDTPTKDPFNMAFDMAQAKIFIKKAAGYYNKPLEQTTLADGLNMLQEEMNDKAEMDKLTENFSKTAQDLTGKPKDQITLADIQAVIDERQAQQPATNKELDFMSEAMAAAKTVKDFVGVFYNAVTRITQSPEFKKAMEVTEATTSFLSVFAENADKIEEITGRAAKFEAEILPYIILEVAERTGERIISDGQAEHWTIDDIKALLAAPIKPDTEKTPFEKEIDRVLDQFSFDGTPETEYAHELLAAAAKRKVAIDNDIEVVETLTALSDTMASDATDSEKAEIIKKELPRIIAQQAEALDYPLDKPNSKIWNLLTVTDPDGQITLNFDTSKKGSGKQALIYYSIDFSALESLPELNITKQLTPFDKRVYIIAAALYNAGNDVITATQIYKADHDKLPSDKDLKKINDSLTKMGAAHIYIDNKNEINVNKNYPKFKYDASLLPFERMSAYINGQLSEAAIHLLREPPLITFARERKQITTIDRQVLLAPVSKTDANLRIEDYLIERISHMKSPHSRAPRKLLFSTIFENCGITEKKQKQRAPEKIRRFLDYYIECELIKNYTETKEGITIIL
jgi:hypothetical protein